MDGEAMSEASREAALLLDAMEDGDEASKEMVAGVVQLVILLRAKGMSDRGIIGTVAGSSASAAHEALGILS